MATLNNDTLVLSTDGLILQLKISLTEGEILLTDNFIDLRKDEQYEVKGVDIPLSKVKDSLVFESYRDVIDEKTLVVTWTN